MRPTQALRTDRGTALRARRASRPEGRQGAGRQGRHEVRGLPSAGAGRAPHAARTHGAALRELSSPRFRSCGSGSHRAAWRPEARDGSARRVLQRAISRGLSGSRSRPRSRAASSICRRSRCRAPSASDCCGSRATARDDGRRGMCSSGASACECHDVKREEGANGADVERRRRCRARMPGCRARASIIRATARRSRLARRATTPRIRRRRRRADARASRPAARVMAAREHHAGVASLIASTCTIVPLASIWSGIRSGRKTCSQRGRAVAATNGAQLMLQRRG